jgi:hypothetical protein
MIVTDSYCDALPIVWERKQSQRVSKAQQGQGWLAFLFFASTLDFETEFQYLRFSFLKVCDARAEGRYMMDKRIVDISIVLSAILVVWVQGCIYYWIFSLVWCIDDLMCVRHICHHHHHHHHHLSSSTSPLGQICYCLRKDRQTVCLAPEGFSFLHALVDGYYRTGDDDDADADADADADDGSLVHAVVWKRDRRTTPAVHVYALSTTVANTLSHTPDASCSLIPQGESGGRQFVFACAFAHGNRDREFVMSCAQLGF